MFLFLFTYYCTFMSLDYPPEHCCLCGGDDSKLLSSVAVCSMCGLGKRNFFHLSNAALESMIQHILWCVCSENRVPRM